MTLCDCSGLTALLRARHAGATFALVHMDAPTVIHCFDLTEVGPLPGLGIAAART
ncbi:hypothetical protein [Streptomyces virginiae]